MQNNCLKNGPEKRSNFYLSNQNEESCLDRLEMNEKDLVDIEQSSDHDEEIEIVREDVNSAKTGVSSASTATPNGSNFNNIKQTKQNLLKAKEYKKQPIVNKYLQPNEQARTPGQETPGGGTSTCQCIA